MFSEKSIESKGIGQIERDENELKAEMLNLLEKYNIKLDTDYKDQHILISREAITQLVDSAELTCEDAVLEIGPGLGQITEALAQKVGKVYAIEIDPRFEPALEDLQKKYENLEVIFDSALDTPWPAVNKLVSSPPYNILEPMIEHLIKKKKIRSSSIVIGEKFYQRCVASSDRVTRSSLLTRAFFDVELVSKVDGKNFLPRSREDSVIMQLSRKDKKKADFGLRLLVSRMINTPNESVKSLIGDIIAEKVNLRTMDYNSIPTIKSLNIPESTLRKSLRDLDNQDISILARTIGSLKRMLRR